MVSNFENVQDKRDEWAEESLWELIPENGIEILNAISELGGKSSTNQTEKCVDLTYNPVRSRLDTMCDHGLVSEKSEGEITTFALNEKSTLVLTRMKPLIRPEGKIAREKTRELVKERLRNKDLNNLQELLDQYNRGEYGNLETELSKEIGLPEDSKGFKDIFASVRVTADAMVKAEIEKEEDKIEEARQKRKQISQKCERIAPKIRNYDEDKLKGGATGYTVKCLLCESEKIGLLKNVLRHFEQTHNKELEPEKDLKYIYSSD